MGLEVNIITETVGVEGILTILSSGDIKSEESRIGTRIELVRGGVGIGSSNINSAG